MCQGAHFPIFLDSGSHCALFEIGVYAFLSALMVNTTAAVLFFRSVEFSLFPLFCNNCCFQTGQGTHWHRSSIISGGSRLHSMHLLSFPHPTPFNNIPGLQAVSQHASARRTLDICVRTKLIFFPGSSNCGAKFHSRIRRSRAEIHRSCMMLSQLAIAPIRILGFWRKSRQSPKAPRNDDRRR